MALSRVTIWVSGQVLTAAALNGEYNNILNNPISLISPTTGAINFNLQAHTNLLPSVITGSSGASTNVLQLSAGLVPIWAAQSGSNPGQGSRVAGLVGSVTSSFAATFTVQQAVLQTTTPATGIPANSFVFGSTAAFTVTVTTSGGQAPGPSAGGRDQAGAFTSSGQFVNFYLISTGNASTSPAGIASLAAPPTGPALPTSYSAWAYLGSYFYTTLQTFNSGRQTGGLYTGTTAATPLAYSSGNTATTGVNTVSLSTVAPVTAGTLFSIWRVGTAHTGPYSAVCRVQLSSGVDAEILAIDNANTLSPTSTQNSKQIPFTFSQTSGQNIFYAVDSSNEYVGVDVTGYRVANGDAA